MNHDSVFRPAVDVELVGFNQHDRTLLTSLFKVSELGPHAYRSWQQNLKPVPDCVLLADDENGETHQENGQGDANGVTVDAKVTEKSSVVLRIHRPFRWAEILHTLDRVVQPDCNSVMGNPNSTFGQAGNNLDATVAEKTGNLCKTTPAVLVINPNPVGWRYITARLASSGYRVDHVSLGAGAMSLLGEFRYNGVIVEPHLPDMDGFEICKLIKQSRDRRRTSAIILTTSRNPLDRIRGDAVGCDAFLSKPVTEQELDSVLQKYLPDRKSV